MRLPIRNLARLASDRRGATIIEFALVSAPLMMLIMGTAELGYRSYLSSQVQGVLYQAARLATLGNKSEAQMDTFVTTRLSTLTKSEYVTIVKKNYMSFTSRGKPEKLTDDKNSNTQYDAGDCYEDANDNGQFDVSAGVGRTGLGGAEDVIYYEVTVAYPRVMPFSLFNQSATSTIKQNTVMRNQPYAKQTPARIRCT